MRHLHRDVKFHEVLKHQNIAHVPAEHRVRFEEPEIDVNIFVDFDGREEEKLNLMQLDAYGDNRDGLALFWAERYIARNSQNDYHLIIVLSDGVPVHDADGYYPPVSTKDTANAVRKIDNSGTDIIGVSLDDSDEFDCAVIDQEVVRYGGVNLLAWSDAEHYENTRQEDCGRTDGADIWKKLKITPFEALWI